MSDLATRFHENWLGLVQPIEGLVVSVPALVAAQCMERQAPERQHTLQDLCPRDKLEDDSEGEPRIADLWALFEELLDLDRSLFDLDDDLPDALQLYVPEGRQTLRPTAALRKLNDAEEPDESGGLDMDDSTPASRAGAAYDMLLWQLPGDLDLDKPETETGPWEYPPSAKFDRLLRECRVPVGLLANDREIRLVYAPHGESSGAMTFRIADMVQVGGRPILDAFIMLLSEFRWFGAEPERRIPAILRDSRSRQADVTNELADQLFEALTILLQGFEAAADRDGDELLRDALRREDEHLYNGLLTLLLRLVFVLYAEDRGLMPTEHPTYGEHLSALALFERLQEDHGSHPDTMGRRYGAYPRLVALFRAVYYGIRHEDLYIPPRSGVLFDPELYPFLEGWSGPTPPIDTPERSAVRVPSVSDEAIYEVLEKLLILGGQRLSYRALEVEQIGSVYEALMGYHVQRVSSSAVCLRPIKLWVEAQEVLDRKPGQRARWLADIGLSKPQAKRVAKALEDAKDTEAVVEALRGFSVKRIPVARPGQLVIQPGEERRRTSSHYTPRSLTEPIVKRTMEPLITAMGGEPPSEKLLRLKICDPAMGSGAFLVAACRFLADQVVAAWTREGVIAEVVEGHEDPVMHARRLVAQRCLYGVDKNPFAVNLAKLSLWLETLAKNEPFTFVDHALKCGDSLVGLSLEQLKRFDWEPDVKASPKSKSKKDARGPKQLELFEGAIERALLAAYSARKRLLELAEAPGDHVELGIEKQRLHAEAEVALERARVIGDVLIGAFFGEKKDKDRKKEAERRKDEVRVWLMQADRPPPTLEIQAWLAEIRADQRPFHWPLEFPEVFWDKRPDPLEDDHVNHDAWVDAVVMNPPFMGQSQQVGRLGEGLVSWVRNLHPECKGKSDYVVHFLRRAHWLIGAHGTIGMIASNTISQGDTREGGLAFLLREGEIIYSAESSRTWPGEAAVSISILHVATGLAQPAAPHRLDGTLVSVIDSRLNPRPERPDPKRLAANASLSFMGCKVGGQGFVLTPAERSRFLASNTRNAERILPYVGGEDVNTHPLQQSPRYVIDFGSMSESEAEQWPDLLEHVRENVKPYRLSVRRESWKRRWWQFAEVYPRMRAAIRGLDRCLVTAIVSKHLIFSFQPSGRIFSHKLYVFPLQSDGSFALMQSRIHAVWAWLLSSTMRSAGINYSASDCFETFAFPGEVSPLAEVGGDLYQKRAAFMVETDQGLTKTYNALKDPTIDDPDVQELRRLHVDMDRAVLDAYGWSDIEVPPYTDPVTPAEKEAHQTFEDQVLDQLFALNAERAAEEAKLGKRKKAKK